MDDAPNGLDEAGADRGVDVVEDGGGLLVAVVVVVVVVVAAAAFAAGAPLHSLR